MKILVLMPLDERHAYIAAKLWSCLTAKAKDKTFNMPHFMDYLVQTEQSKSFEEALFQTILSAEWVYNTASENNDDLIIFGNLPQKYKFDAIFSFQDPDVAEPFKDNFVNNMKKIVKNNKDLTEEERKLLNSKLAVYEADACKLPLQNYIAAADFLSAYLDTNPHLEEIQQKYNERLITKGK